ncbi:nonsense-mediated mRNA decay protein 5 [[Candida] railenensis]|uniref:Nonsense-mediated mRNA decay protein 5 n=1 Tax=[Candida] railenensis TaxID=45579 RepID=A0A9P0VWI3_9ASCO|nr:nonsense-mediated mRNA decay protein 5 [[Candida] railenensis]
MDANVLLECFACTLSANQNIRQQAELRLKELSNAPGFLGGCLDIIGSKNLVSIDTNVRKAAAVYFKNRIVKYWMIPVTKDTLIYIDNDEKPVIKDRILEVMINSDYHIQQQLIPVLRVLISFEFPQRWGNLLNDTGDLLQQVPESSNSDDASYTSLYTGLLCFSEICRKFRWVSNEDREKELDPIIQQVFPHLLNIGNNILADPSQLTEFKAEILKLILKIYKFVTYFDLPKILQTRDAVISWGQFHGSIFNLQAPAYIETQFKSLNEREKSILHISKCYKWSLANLYRLFTRYSSNGISKKYNYTDFHKMFLNELIPQLIQNFLQIIEQWCSKLRWLPISALYYLLQFLSHSVTQKSTWLLIKPFFETLISHFIYPLLCPMDEILEIYEADPLEYIHINFDIYDEINTPDIAALGLLVTFVDKRKNSTLDTIVNFAYLHLQQLVGAVSAGDTTLETAKKIEGILRLIGCISHYILIPQSKYYPQMETFLNKLILPNLNSNYEFVRARALEITSKFADLEFEENGEFHTIAKIFHAVDENFDLQTKSLPLALQCALAIQSYLPKQQFKDAMGSIILPIMSKLLELSEEIDNDSISIVMQDCVENFSEQLQPFGVDLMTKLVEQFMRLCQEVNESTKEMEESGGIDYDASDDSSEKIMAAIGLLNTMITVLLSFENSQSILVKLEEVYYPIIEYVIVNKIDDLFAEIGELIENSTFLLRSISPTMWRVFKLLSQSFHHDGNPAALNGGGIALLYTEELIPSLNNFLIYGQADLLENDEIINGFFGIFMAIVDGDEEQVDFNDISFACELGQNFILTLRQKSTPFLMTILGKVLGIFQNMTNDKLHVRNNSYDVNVSNVIVATFIYDLPNAIAFLEHSGFIEVFFERWMKLIPMLKRVYDIKLSILGLISIVSDNEILAKFESGGNNNFAIGLVNSIIHLLKLLPDAIKNLEERRKNFNELDDEGMQRLWEQDQEAFNKFTRGGDEDDDEEYEDFGDEAEDSTNNEEFDSFLKEQEESFKLKSSGFYDEDDEQINEDPLSSTPLDNLNVFKFFKDFLISLQSNDLHKYQSLFGKLNESDQHVIQDVFEIVTD